MRHRPGSFPSAGDPYPLGPPPPRVTDPPIPSMRSLPLVLPLLFAAACHTLTNEEQDRLAMYQRNAGLYFEGAKY